MKEIFRDPVLKKLGIRCIALNLVLAGLWCLVPWAGMSWVKGQLLGCAVAVLFFGQMRMTLEKSVCLSPPKAGAKVRMGYAIRMMIYAVLFFLSYQSKEISLITVLLGVVSMKYTVLASFALDKKMVSRLNRPKKED